MAVGDVIEKTLISKSLSATASDSSYANTSSSYRTVVTSIIITGQVAASTKREITIYKGGTAAANERINVDIDPTGNDGSKTVTIDTPFVLTGTETIYAKQDTGTDVNIEVSGTYEQIA
jgi:hypothetical protein